MLKQLKNDRLAQLMLIGVFLVGCLACGIWGLSLTQFFTSKTPTSAESLNSPTPTNAPTSTPKPDPIPTPNLLLGERDDLVSYFERNYDVGNCALIKDGDFISCLSYEWVVIAFYGDPVHKALVNIPADAFDDKPAKYASALLSQTGLDSSAWDWLVSQMKNPTASRVFGDRRVSSIMDDEKWLVTVEIVR